MTEKFEAKEIACDTLTARQIVLKGAEGVSRAVFVVEENRPHIELLDNNGETALSLTVSLDGRASLQINDAGGASRIGIGLTPEGDPAVLLKDGAETRLSLHLVNGCGEMCIYNKEGELRSTLRELPDGELQFSEFDGEEAKGEDF